MPASRVLVLTSTYPRWEGDSIPVFVEMLCLELLNNDLEVVVLAPHCLNAKKFEILNGVTVHRFNYAPARFEKIAYEGGILSNIRRSPFSSMILLVCFIFSQSYSAISLIYRYKCTVIHAHWLVPQGFVAVVVKKILFWKNLSVLVTAHGSDVNNIKGRFYNFIKNWICKTSNATSAVSEDVAKKLSFSRDLYIRSMGVDTKNLFVPPDYESRSYLMFVGRLVPSKGCDVLLRAFSLVVKNFPLLKLKVVGDGPELNNLKKLCLTLKLDGKVEFVGRKMQSELPEYYCSALICIVPSTDKEGFGLVAAEAMACRCPVIASDVSAINKLIDKEHGLLAKPGDVEDLAKMVTRLLRNSDFSLKLASRGRQKVIENYSWDIVGSDYANIIRNISR